MALPAVYELLDAGGWRRLERFGSVVVDRPAPAAREPVRDPARWAEADLTYDRDVGWTSAGGDIEPWQITDGDLRFELWPTDAGQVGLFPEQAPNRAWIRDAVSRTAPEPTLLNLFAYTGAVTLAAAAAGASVTHVDGARPNVAWARRNAALSGLTDRPIRWIVDDVDAFVAREIRRDRPYDAVVLDPPSHGHGRRGEPWRLEDRLPPLLAACSTITAGDPAFAILTAHTPGFTPERLADELATAFRRRVAAVEAGELALRARSGAHLRLGAYARIIRG
jgi:23S rRNA (cytosine1962-C5)-methyltransferase